MSNGLRLASAVLSASDQLSNRLVGCDARSVTDQPPKGSKSGQFVIEIGDGDDDDDVIRIIVPHEMAGSFADSIGDMFHENMKKDVGSTSFETES